MENMNNILAYLDWRGDLSFSKSPFNEVDNLIFSMLCYLPLEKVVPKQGKRAISLVKAAEKYFSDRPVPDRSKKAEHSGEAYDWLFYRMANTDRYRKVSLSDYVSIMDEKEGEHFAALCIHIDSRSLYIAFRGTADKLIGWKEDFLLACLPTIPSHNEAVWYLVHVAKEHPKAVLYTGGHSKGGNLAIYAAAKAPVSVQDRIACVWSNDGPGFQPEFLEGEDYQRIAGRIRTIVPESSVIGLLLAHGNAYKVVGSTQTGLMQHDGFSWEVSGTHFVEVKGLSSQSMQMNQKIRSWIEEIPPAKRQRVVDFLFELLSASGATTLSEVRKGKLKVAIAALPQMMDLPKDVRDRILEFFFLLEQTSLRLSVEGRLKKTISERI